LQRHFLTNADVSKCCKELHTKKQKRGGRGYIFDESVYLTLCSLTLRISQIHQSVTEAKQR